MMRMARKLFYYGLFQAKDCIYGYVWACVSSVRVCVCLHVRVFVPMCVWEVCVYMYMYTYIYECVYMHQVCVCMHASMCVYICECICVCTRLIVCVCVCMHASSVHV